MQEQIRLAEAREKTTDWKQFGPYLTERQWGTVREDYSANGDAWNYITHDMARAYAYRWGEEGLGGLIPLFAVEVIDDELLATVPEFYARALALIQRRPRLAELVSRWQEPGQATRHLMGLMRQSRLRSVLTRMLDESEFLSEFGIRSLSRYHLDNPYWYHLGEKDSFSVSYVAGEAESDMFGGNSNWRGPVWFPVNYLIIESLQRYHAYYGDSFTIEYPTGSGQLHTLAQVADALSARLACLFLKDENGRRPALGNTEIHQTDPHFRDHLLFHEYFHGDDGYGLGASHQTGWTGLVVRLLHQAEAK